MKISKKINKKGRHSNEFMRTSFANSGRIAGDGILSDDYSETSMGGYYNQYPSPEISQYTKKEWEELTKEQPVKVYKLEGKSNDTV